MQKTHVTRSTNRLLRAGVDGMAFISQGQQLADVLGRVQVLQGALDAVCTVVESTLPQSRQVYRDEYGSVFLVSDAHGLLDRPDAAGRPLGQLVHETFAAGTAGEACLGTLELSEPFPHGDWPGDFLYRPVPLLSADPRTVASWWTGSANTARETNVCAVCRLRPQGHGAEGAARQEARAQGICCTCLARRQHQTRDRASVLGVVKENGQMALVAGQMHLTRPPVSNFWSSVQPGARSPSSSHVPIVPILAGPRTFLALAPTGEALALVRASHARHQEEPDLPPLALALAIFPRHVPLFAVLDAGRRMLLDRPGTFDFITLDTAARRFDICYDAQGRRRDRPTRPYRLEDLATLEELGRWSGPGNLAPARRRDLLALVEAKREAWGQPAGGPEAAYDDAFRQLVRDALAQVSWWGEKPDEETMARLHQAALTGVLADVDELRI